MSQVIYSQPGWPSPFLGRGNSVGPPALSGVIMSSVKHNQSPRCTPLYKPRGPPINRGWLGDLSLRADRRAEASVAADIGLNPDADVRGGLLVSCPPGTDRFILSQRGEKCPWEGMVLQQLFTSFWSDSKKMGKCCQSSQIYQCNLSRSKRLCITKEIRQMCWHYTTFDQN